jgi:hypothetical protein
MEYHVSRGCTLLAPIDAPLIEERRLQQGWQSSLCPGPRLWKTVSSVQY